MGSAFKNELDFYDYCFQFSETTSLRVLEDTTSLKNISSNPIENDEDLRYDHWICSIAVALGEAKVYVKAHFDSRTARKVAAISTELTALFE